jgi:hypothetical protein
VNERPKTCRERKSSAERGGAPTGRRGPKFGADGAGGKLGLLALIHLMPAIALVRPSLITRLYVVQPSDRTFLLLHHRAALFLAIFVICMWAIFDPGARRIAAVAVAISMLSFLWLFLMNGSPAALRSIAIADLIGLPALAYVTWRAFSAA